MRFLFALLLPGLASSGIWPDQLGSFHRTTAAPAALADRALADEYGLQEGETVQYAAGDRKFTATAYRFQDSTGAMAAFEWLRPAGARSSGLARLAAETSAGVMLAHGNYLFSFQGYRPLVEEMAGVLQVLPKLEDAPLPSLPNYLPSKDLVPNSERYVVGPTGLAQFDPVIPPSTAAFHLAAEAQIGTFRGAGGEMKLAIFNYPTPQLAMQRAAEFQKIPGAMAKRTGPLVAVVVSPPDTDAAERLLALVRYQASITLSERLPTRRDNIGDLIVNIFVLTGVLLAFSAVAGLAFGSVHALLRRGPAGDAMILLHLEDRRG